VVPEVSGNEERRYPQSSLGPEFAKNEKDNLSKSERNSLAALVGELARHFKR
jgi:hypothetical protein